ncbi:hypothetical protein [Petroclostridium sp. X23]|uniref:hypothetical protein n=1 Tax=Petroclostridium sp. X23 TaxID=3045146 RepID=UPI0024AE12EF|nr:hypothetical protein [Petroclostridium sp. X23]WHH60339.1 hypothetical protein QKW49_06275 [Petroclostridium sp. X23]
MVNKKYKGSFFKHFMIIFDPRQKGKVWHKLKSKNFKGIELIRPMYYVKEDDIKRFTSSNGSMAMNCGCVVAAQKTSSKRREVKQLIKALKKNFDVVDKCIFQSAQNVNLNSVLGWEKRRKEVFIFGFL